MKNKKAQEININVLFVAAIALICLVALLIIFRNYYPFEEKKKEFVIEMDLKEDSEGEYRKWMNTDCKDRECLKAKFFSFTSRCNDLECLDFFNLLLTQETYKILYYEYCLNTTDYNENALKLCEDYREGMGEWKDTLEV